MLESGLRVGRMKKEDGGNDAEDIESEVQEWSS